MAKTLTDAQVAHFREQGWLAPLRALDAAQAADWAARIVAYEARMGKAPIAVSRSRATWPCLFWSKSPAARAFSTRSKT